MNREEQDMYILTQLYHGNHLEPNEVQHADLLLKQLQLAIVSCNMREKMEKKKPVRITDETMLRELAMRNGGVDCSIQLKQGLLSSKHISYDEDEQTYCIDHEIDGTEQVCTAQELWTETNIGMAIDEKCLWWRQDIE